MPLAMRSNVNNGRTAGPSMRIPATLQAVFLASNRGKEVHKPPPQQVAYKEFFRSFFFQRGSSSKDDKKMSLFLGSRRRKKQDARKSDPRKVSTTKQLKQQRELPRKEAAAVQPVEEKSTIVVQPTPKVPEVLSPQKFLDSLLQSRGYSTKTYKSLHTAYYNKPTELQKASYDVHLVEMVRAKDTENFAKIMSSGISPNPCNAYGESLVHMLCRRGDYQFLEILLSNGCSLQITDDYGRTPMHDACWGATPSFTTVEIVLKHDMRLFYISDTRGALPLSYVNKDHYAAWIEFFDSRKDVFWPVRNILEDGEEGPPPLTQQEPNTRPIPDPKDALTPQLAGMVASGRMEPEEAHFLKYDIGVNSKTVDSSEDEDDSEYSDDSEESEDEDSDGSYDDEDDESTDFAEEEMAELLQSLSAPGQKAAAWSQ